MALASTTDSSSTTGNTPTPYRVPTSAVRVWTPREVTTAEHAAIRAQITPNRGWWQFPLPTMPWEALLAIQVYVATVGLGVIAIAAIAFFGGHR